MTELGTVLDGKYEILKKVGQGGMSIVYLAMDNRLNKQWAVKEIKNDGSKSTATLLKSLEREAQHTQRCRPSGSSAYRRYYKRKRYDICSDGFC